MFQKLLNLNQESELQLPCSAKHVLCPSFCGQHIYFFLLFDLVVHRSIKYWPRFDTHRSPYPILWIGSQPIFSWIFGYQCSFKNGRATRSKRVNKGRMRKIGVGIFLLSGAKHSVTHGGGRTGGFSTNTTSTHKLRVVVNKKGGCECD